MTITIQQFSAWYGCQQILDTINVNFKTNTISAIIGPSGCGKTTLLKSMNRTAELSQTFRCKGEILLKDIKLYNASDATEIRRAIGMVFQKPIVLPFSIKKNVLFGPHYYGITNQHELDNIMETCLKKVGLWVEVQDKLHNDARELSGGQQQRLAIARALAIEPQVLLLDEPCSSLDIVSTKVIEELLQNLSKQLTIIIVTHNLAQTKRIAEETFFMTNGKLIESGTTQTLFNQPQQQQTIDFLAE